MTKKNSLQEGFFDEYEKAEKKKTKNCLSEEKMWEYLQKKMDKELNNKLDKHIKNCPYCLRLRSDIKLYIKPPKVKIPKEISDAMDKVIDNIFLKETRIEVSFSYKEKKSKMMIDKVRQFYKDNFHDIPFQVSQSIVQDNAGVKIKGEYSKFKTKEISGTVYQKEKDITIILEKTKDFPDTKEIDDLKIIIILKNEKPIIKKPSRGIIKIAKIQSKNFTVYIK